MVPLRSRRGFVTTTCAFFSFAPLLPCLAAEYVQKNITDTPNFCLLPGVASVPAPVSISPDQSWMGIDGAWNTFSLHIGDPGASVRVLVSTASQQIWAINRMACIANVSDPTTGAITEINVFDSRCQESRGGLYNSSDSVTWQQKGFYQLWIGKYLGLLGNGLYGFDSVGLGMRGDQGPYVENTTIGTLVTANFWLGHIGVHPKPTNFSAFEDPVPSYLTKLFEQKSIPSLSFGYTAGAQYRDQTMLGSLTLGGYDASRFISNDLTFIFAPDNERDLVVGVVGITANTAQAKDIDLLKRDDVTMYIDSTIAELYLPFEICQAFEDAFGLQHDEATDLYLVNDALHKSLLSQNPTVTFTLGQKFSSNATVQITLPYASLDLEASPPYRGLQEKTRYFPIRRSNESREWVLGRSFLQEAYLTVDWERENFTLSAIDWTFGKAPQILPIVSPDYSLEQSTPLKSSPLTSAAIIGIAVGGGLFFALVACAFGWWFWRRQHKRSLEAMKAKYEAAVAAAAANMDPPNLEEPPTWPIRDSAERVAVFPKVELPGGPSLYSEVGSSAQEKGPLGVNEADGTEGQIYEMPGDMPVRQEADGRQLSEKESMVVRERIYNGVDVSGGQHALPMIQEAPRRLEIMSPSEVSLVNGRLHSDNVSPISPLEGSTDASRRRFSYES